MGGKSRREEGGGGDRLRRGSQIPAEDGREPPDTQGQPSEPRPRSHGGSQNHLHPRVRERPCVPEELRISLGFPWEGPSCGFASVSSPALMHPQPPLLPGGFSPSSQGTQTGITFFQQLRACSKPFSPPHRGLHHSPVPPRPGLLPARRSSGAFRGRNWTRVPARPAGPGMGPEAWDVLLACPRRDVLRHIVIVKPQMQNLAPPIHIFIFLTML